MFQSPIMLTGIAIAVAPVVLHFLNRARVRQMPWGAMMFISPTNSQSGSSDRLRQYILLGMRMFILALLAVAMARPVIRSDRPQPLTAIILLDDSSTMGFSVADLTRLDEARQLAREILRAMLPGDLAQIILMGNGNSNDVPTEDLQKLTDGLDDLHAQ